MKTTRHSNDSQQFPDISALLASLNHENDKLSGRCNYRSMKMHSARFMSLAHTHKKYQKGLYIIAAYSPMNLEGGGGGGSGDGCGGGGPGGLEVGTGK